MQRRIVATMFRGLSKEKVWVRYYNYFDTAMPRAVQLAISYGAEGDVVEFASTELGFQLGTLRVRKGGRVNLEMSPLVKASANLLKLMSI